MAKPEPIAKALRENRRRRERAAADVDRARVELARLLARGRAAGMTVSAMCELAGLSRETAHRLLREGDAHAG